MFQANADAKSAECPQASVGAGRRRRLNGRRPGAVLVLVAVSLVGLVAVTALAIDIGMLYSARGEAQRTADAAALAGASAFIDFDPQLHPAEAYAAAESRAYDFATRQTLMGEAVINAEVTPQIVMDSQKVRVYVRRQTIPLLFARIFGLNLGSVSAVAAAEAVYAGSSNCIKPLAIPDMWHLGDPTQDLYTRGNDPPIWDFDAHLFPEHLPQDAPTCRIQGQRRICDPEVWSIDGSYDADTHGYASGYRDGVPDYQGRTYTEDEGRRVPLKVNNPQGSTAPSYFFPWRQPGSTGGKDYEEALKGCVDGSFNIGQTVDLDVNGVQTEPGNMIGPTRKGIDDMISRDPGAHWVENADGTGYIAGSSFANPLASPRVIVVALINPMDIASGMNTMRFVNFARFFLEDPAVVYPHVNPNHQAPITGRLMKYASGQSGPEEGTLIKRLRLIE
jgi:hypothetical protein